MSASLSEQMAVFYATEIEEQRAEIERLRAALERIIVVYTDGEGSAKMYTIARAALRGYGSGHG